MTTKKQIEEKIWDYFDKYNIATHEDEGGVPCADEIAQYMYDTIKSKSEWISVDDRLPSSEGLERSQFHNFLVANEFGEVREAVFTGKYFAKLGSRLSGVTHWMPLPEPPKGAEQ